MESAVGWTWQLYEELEALPGNTRHFRFMWLQLWLLHVWIFLNERIENMKKLILFWKMQMLDHLLPPDNF